MVAVPACWPPMVGRNEHERMVKVGDWWWYTHATGSSKKVGWF